MLILCICDADVGLSWRLTASAVAGNLEFGGAELSITVIQTCATVANAQVCQLLCTVLNCLVL